MASSRDYAANDRRGAESFAGAARVAGVRRIVYLGGLGQIGGAAGWYYGNSLWRLRGLVDLAVGGPGLRRGRRDQESVSWRKPGSPDGDL